MLKVIIAGSRTITDYNFIRTNTLKVFKELKERGIKTNKDNVEIVSGNARGVDRLGERFANEFGLKLTVMPADWSLGRQSGILRNIDMLNYIKPNGILIAFCENDSPGTSHIIKATDYHQIEKFIFNIGEI